MKENKDAQNIMDNTPGREVVNVIKDQLKKSKQAKFAIGYFFLSGFNLVKEDFPKKYVKKPFLKIIMGNETTAPTKEELVEGYNLRELFKQRMIEDLQKKKLTEEQKNRIKGLRELVANNIIEVKLFDKSRLHAKLYLFLTKPNEKYGSPGLAIVGSSNFTAEGLTKNKELNVLLTSREEVLYLDNWFNKLWNESIEFNADLIKIIDISGVLPGSDYPKIGRYIDPQTLFKYLIYRWFGNRILGLPNKDILMEFQLVGVANAVNILDFYNGVILADSVGLGKSFMAAEVIDEFTNGSHPNWICKGKIPAVLLILPPSLIPQWESLLIEQGYFLKNNYKKLTKEKGNYKEYTIYDKNKRVIGKIGFLSLGILQNMKEDELKKFANQYDLFIIDEAHKYRNKNTNRWKNVRMLRTKDNGFNNKFMLLTATPLNNSIEDIYNLIRLFMDDAFTPFTMKNIDVIGLIKEYKKLKREIQNKDDDNKKRELKIVADKIKKNILDEIMVLRTRKYILEQFKDLKINGRPLIFKDPTPHSLDYSSFYTSEYKDLIKTIKKNINRISFEYTKLYGTRFLVFEEESIDEESNEKHYVEIADLFKLLLGKRLESGIYAFETTLKRIYEKEKIFYNTFKPNMESILNKEKLKKLILESVEKAKIEKELEAIQEEYSVEEEKEQTWFDRVIKILLEYTDKAPTKSMNDIERLKYGLNILLKKIESDLRYMEDIFNGLDKLKKIEHGKPKSVGKIPKSKEDIIEIPIYIYKNDPKIDALKQIIGVPSYKSEKLHEIPSLYGKKIIVFTQYRDTAYYLYHNLTNWVKNEVDMQSWLKDNKGRIKIGLVTGDTDTQTKINYIKRFSPQANNGYEEIERNGEIDILISTDALSEGINLQDADAVINYDLPWNPMVLVQRVGRVNRIGNEKDIDVINYIPSGEIEVIVGILKKLKDKIKDITLIVGKDTRILTPEEEISIETFGEKIKKISRLKPTDLEQYGLSEDFKQFIPKGIPQEQLDEYKLLNIVQYELGFTNEDFKEIEKMNDGPYYSFISGNDKTVSIYEIHRGNFRIMKKIISISKDGKIKEETPLIFLDLIKKKSKRPQKIENAIENLKKIRDKKIEEIIETLREGSGRSKRRGFLKRLYNNLLIEKGKAKEVPKEFVNVMNTLKNVPEYPYSGEIKSILEEKGLIKIDRDNVIINNFNEVINILNDLFNKKGLNIKSLKPSTNHIGWFYEI